MTIRSIRPVKEKKSRKYKQAVVNEQSPLLPTKHQEDGGFDEFNGASFSGAVFNLSTTIVGAGIMALPATMKVLGLIPGIIMIILMAFLTEASIELLIRFSRTSKSVSYGGLMDDAFGKYRKMLLQICVLVNNIGVLVVYMIIIGDVLSRTTSSGTHHAGVLEGRFGVHWWTGRFFVLLVTTLAVFAPLACLKRIDSLRYTSALSVTLAVVFVVVTVGITIFKLINGSILMPRLLPNFYDLTSFLKLFTVVPVLLCAHLMLVFPIVFYPLQLNLDGLVFPYARPLTLDDLRFALISGGLISIIFSGANFIPSIWDAFQFTGATAAVCIGFIFPAAVTLRDQYGIATKRDKILCIFMIVLAVFSNLVAIYSDAYALIKKNSPSRE
ncbi:unnamed protein product [Withania somnifera]